MDDYTVGPARSHLAEVRPRRRHLVDTVYFGGGTPSYLGTKRLCSLLGAIRKSIPVAQRAEITLEANPDSCRGLEKALRTLRRAGFNRISLGMQSTDDEMLGHGPRPHLAAGAGAVAAARKAGFPELSGPHLRPARADDGAVGEDLFRRPGPPPEHLSCYGLKLEEGTPLFRSGHR